MKKLKRLRMLAAQVSQPAVSVGWGGTANLAVLGGNLPPARACEDRPRFGKRPARSAVGLVARQNGPVARSTRASMKPFRLTLFSTTAAVALLLCLAASKSFAAETFKPDSEGYIRHWLMLAPISLPVGDSGSEAIFRQQIRDEATLRPKAGDKVTVGGKELTWQSVTAATNYFDFAAVVKALGEKEAGYAVTYIECETEKRDVIMAVASNDEGRIYFNGVDIYVFGEPRTLTLDADKGKVTLKKGVNVVVFKIINEQGNWLGAMRLLDKGGAPLKDLKIKLSP